MDDGLSVMSHAEANGARALEDRWKTAERPLDGSLAMAEITVPSAPS